MHLFRVVVFFVSVNACAQVSVPRLIRYSGSYHGAENRGGAVAANFSIYRGEYDTSPLWTEIQNAQPDASGNFTALLGSTRSDGMPVELFFTTEPRWLEVEIDRVKQPRVLLSSVPYALRASDADTLGGLPAAAYLRADSPGVTVVNRVAAAAEGVSPLVNNGSPGCIGVFSNATDLICSAMSQSVFQGNPAVSIGSPTTYYGAMTLVGNVPFGDAAGMSLYNAGGGGGSSVSLDMYNTPFNSGIPQAKMKAIDDGAYSDHLTFWTKNPGAPGNVVAERLRITSSGSVGIGTVYPAQKLEVAGMGKFDGGVMFGDGTSQTTAMLVGPAGPQGPQGPAGPQGATGPQGAMGPAGPGGITVSDANNNVLGKFAGFPVFLTPPNLPPPVFWVFRNGYFVDMTFNGSPSFGGMLDAVQNKIYWSGANCSGSGYISSGSVGATSSRFVVYSNQNNSFYVVSGSGVVASASAPYSSAESPMAPFSSLSGCGNGVGTINNVFPLSPFNASAILGWQLSGNPLSVAGPVQLQ